VKHIVETETDLLNRMPFAPAVTQDPLNPIEAWPTVRDRIQSALDTPNQAEHAYDGFFAQQRLSKPSTSSTRLIS
jgi:hypothetical protein